MTTLKSEPVITIYTSKDCCLCKSAKKVIVNTQKKRTFSYKEIDITTDKTLLAKFKEEVPVIFINEKKAFKYRVDQKELIEKIDRLTRQNLT